MTTPDPRPPRKKRRPQKIVTDEARAQVILDELAAAGEQIRSATERRRELAAEGASIGLTMRRIGDAVGVSPMAVSRWLRGHDQSI